jgi:dihydrofolate reductase
VTLPLWLVVAVAKNNVIGGDNRLLWHIRTDLQRFKALTMGKPMVMGRKTFASIGKALPGRETIVVTRDRNFSATGVHVAHDLPEALRRAEALGTAMGADAVAIIGGGEIYAQTRAHAVRLYVTEVDLAPEGDTYFPQPEASQWREVKREAFTASDRDEADFVFVDYERM